MEKEKSKSSGYSLLGIAGEPPRLIGRFSSQSYSSGQDGDYLVRLGEAQDEKTFLQHTFG
jgi:hypothetical protein